jgi:hypothetical protein
MPKMIATAGRPGVLCAGHPPGQRHGEGQRQEAEQDPDL